ncbi:MAG TPA: acyltransferase [Micropepsaceae bacterium]|nr:acyltransferase [Micropepsaceae bacterium]
MRSPNTRYNPAIDQLRGCAALLILYYHAHEFLLPQIQNVDGYLWPSTLNPLYALLVEGHSAVALFMVLSGFIFTQVAMGSAINYRAFIFNRVLRIYPLMVSILLLALALHPEAFRLRGIVKSLLLFFTFPSALNTVLQTMHIAQFLWQSTDIQPWTAIFWTIIPEFQFYFLFPVLLATLDWKGPRAIVGLICLAIFMRLSMLVFFGTKVVPVFWYYTLTGRIDQFLLGMLAAWFWSNRSNEERARTSKRFPAACALVLSALTIFNQLGGLPATGGWRVIWPTVEALAWGAFILTFVARGGVKLQPFSRSLTWIGEISFSLYLLHWPILIFVNHYAAELFLNSPVGFLGHWAVVATTFITTFMIAPVVIAISSTTYVLIEKPFLSRRVRYLRHRAAGHRFSLGTTTP